MVSARGATLWKMRVLQPIDIRFGVDLHKRSSRRWLMHILERCNPRLAIVEYPCTVWSVLQSNVNYRDRPDELQALRDADRPFLRLTADIFRAQVQRGGHAIAENPASAASHVQPEILQLRSTYYETTSCLCMFGLTGRHGQLMQKRVRFIATHPYFVEALDWPCDRSHPHELVEGSNTASSACYPPALADAICRAFWRIVEEEDCGTTTYVVDSTPSATAPGSASSASVWYVDVNREEVRWRPLLVFVSPESPLYGKICSLVPWQVMNIQVAHLPKAKRVRTGLEECHRASVMLTNDDRVIIETEHLKTAQAPRERCPHGYLRHGLRAWGCRYAGAPPRTSEAVRGAERRHAHPRGYSTIGGGTPAARSEPRRGMVCGAAPGSEAESFGTHTSEAP